MQAFAQDQLVMDPTGQEERLQSGSLLLASMPSINEITHLVERGVVDVSIVNEAIERGMESCSKLYQALQECLVETIRKKNKKSKK
jgi:ribonuclease PH